jgi:hypothetical protein
MSQDSQQAIMHVLQQDSAILESLLSKLRHLKELQGILNQYLEPRLASRCLVANQENSSFTIITESALWATQFRFQIPALLTKLKEHPELAHITKIICKIRPAPNKPAVDEKNIKTMPKLSSETAEMILQAAKNIRHEKLQAIMQKIAQNKD